MIDKLFVLLNDITDKNSGDIVEKIGIEDSKTYNKKPKECPSCYKKSMAGIEVLGAYDNSLIWQCMKCGDRFLKLSRTRTLKLLEDATSAWTNPSDWGDTYKKLN
tara:strand:- start:196 stop:510 length:315 start_codon:yes stop_codon:yes gene_type:complete